MPGYLLVPQVREEVMRRWHLRQLYCVQTLAVIIVSIARRP